MDGKDCGANLAQIWVLSLRFKKRKGLGKTATTVGDGGRAIL